MSIFWKLPVLYLSIGPPIGLVLGLALRRRDPRFARAALVMQAVGTLLAILLMMENPKSR